MRNAAEIAAHHKRLSEALRAANLPDTFAYRRAADVGFKLARGPIEKLEQEIREVDARRVDGALQRARKLGHITYDRESRKWKALR